MDVLCNIKTTKMPPKYNFIYFTIRKQQCDGIGETVKGLVSDASLLYDFKKKANNDN